MIFELSQEFTFEAAHTLVRQVPLAEYGPSRRIHGHTYTATVVVEGERGASGMLEQVTLTPPGKIVRKPLDLFYLRQAIAKVRDTLDHRLLDEVEGLGPATLENLAWYILLALPDLPVSAVTVRRGATGDACTVRKKRGA